MRLTFRHLDATFPKYMVRTFGSNTPYGSVIAINPLLIIVLLPAITAFTMHFSAFQMILLGAWVSAASVFILVVSASYTSAVRRRTRPPRPLPCAPGSRSRRARARGHRWRPP